jgi:secreted trypsin-like serine protease
MNSLKILIFFCVSVFVVDGFGRKNGMKIFGGRRIDVKNSPFLAQFASRGRVICGSAIISSTWALTAAHCTDGRQTDVSLIIESSVRSNGEIVPVKQVIQHENYNPGTFNFDISLLQFDPITFNEKVSPAKLPSSSDKSPPVGSSCVVSGFGLKENNKVSVDLLTTNISVINPTTCQRNYNRLNFKITENMFCVGSATGKQDSCSGDSVIINILLLDY